MRFVVWFLIGFMLVATGGYAATPETTPARPAGAAAKTGTSVTPSGPAVEPPPFHAGRFQMFLAPGHSGSPFLIDTATGCVWHQVQHQETKRTTFVEVDVENLHWSWGSGAQQILGSRVDGSNLTDEQKRTLKESIQKTGCGLSNVVLTPGPAPAAGQPSGGQAPSK